MAKNRNPTKEHSWIKCPRCARHWLLYRHRTLDYMCRYCGCLMTADFEKKVMTEKKGE
jgi:ribosomal protein S27E